MSTQQDIYAASSKNRPPMLNKDNYVPWSSRLLRYAKSKPNGKLLVNSIKNGPYVRRMIIKLEDPNSVPHVAESNHEQTNDELTEKEEKKAKLFNERESFKSTEEELIEYYYHHFTKVLHEVDYNRLYDFLKMNQEEVNELKAERLAKTHDPLAFMESTQTPYNYPVFHPDQPSQIT
nr:hypothetical protein [Tanacetum cinerariifolium]